MQNTGAEAEDHLEFVVRYARTFDTTGNPDFRGKGRLTVRKSAQQFVFSGKPRGRTLFSPPRELELGAGQIWNVFVKGDRVQFQTSEGKAGRQKAAFSFFCGTPGTASQVADLLPATRDADFQEFLKFDARLGELEASSPWTSVTNLIVAANVLVFVGMGLLGAGWLEPGDMMPYVRFGANNGAATTDGEWWRLLTSMFMHYGLVHLALNMWALIQVGHIVEKLLGRKAYVLVYFGSGFIGGLASLFWHGDKIWSVGASGAIFGVYGSLLGFMARDEQLLPKTVYRPLLKSTALFVGYNLFYGAVQPSIDNACHCGGLLGGFILGWLTAVSTDPELRARFEKRRFRDGVIAAVLLMGVGVAVAPHFGYKPVDELNWQKANAPQVAKEQDVIKQQNIEINRYRSTGDPDKLSIWMTYQAIPFYDGWRNLVIGLPLEQGRITDRRRDAFARILQMKVDSYRQLLADANGSEPYPLRRFDDSNKAIVQAVQEIPVQ